MNTSPISLDSGLFIFSDAARTVSARAEEHEFIEGSQSQDRALVERVRARLAQLGPRARMFGALPFDPRDRVRIFCTEMWSELEPWSLQSLEKSRPSSPPSESSDRPRFEANVADAISAFEGGPLRKVVLARQRTVPLDRLSLPLLLTRLRAHNPTGTLYALGLPPVAGISRALVGVSPELLLSKKGDRVFSAPLAGTIARSADPATDRARASALRASAKDLGEHRIVTEGIRAALEPFVDELQIDPEPTLHATETLWHLRTDIRGSLRDQRTSSLELALALHPTPAVGGEPRELALDFVRRHEGFSRGFFAGAIGHMDAAGDGEWMVAIRCAEVSAQFARVFAGAGIVQDSVAGAEYDEIEAKMGTMLSALGYRA